MSNRPKYIAFSISGFEKPQFIIFDQWQAHDESLRHIDHMFPGRVEVKAISAGFVRFSGDQDTGKMNVEAFGESYTLGIGSKSGDSQFLKEHILNGLSCTFFRGRGRIAFLASSLSFKQLEDRFEFHDLYFQGRLHLTGEGQDLRIANLDAEFEAEIADREQKFLNCLIHSSSI
jgi:hypothetical protein